MRVYTRWIDLDAPDPDPKPIEIEIWEPDPEKPGYLRYAGNRRIKDVYDELCKRLKEEGVYPDEGLGMLLPLGLGQEDPFPRYRWIACFAVTGDSEGRYVHVEVVTPEGGRELLFLGKTFKSMDFAYEVAKACAKHLGA